MAVYTDISDEALEAFLADYDLGRPLSFKGIAEGVENSNFLLETEAGRYILTLYERRVREADLPYFIGLMRWLSERGFPCPTPVADRMGQPLKRLAGRPAAIVTFLTGLAVKRPSATHCREVGAGLASLHLAAEGFPIQRPNGQGQSTWIPLFGAHRARAETLKPGLAAVIEGDLAHLAQCWPSRLPEGVIHEDLFPDNVFFSGERFAAAIDFYFACNDVLAYDIGVCLNAWCFEPDGGFNATKARALVTGYESRRPLSPAERGALPVLAHGSAMRFFLTRLADWGATPDGALVRPKDPLEYEAKLAFHRYAGGRLELFGEEP